jgi:hypothetical protein
VDIVGKWKEMLKRFVFANLKGLNIKGVKVKAKFNLEQATRAQR